MVLPLKPFFNKNMANYRGYFRGYDRIDANNQNGDLYCIHIGEFSASTYTELIMGSDPFVVQYSTSNTPFDPVRTSTATMTVFNSGYTVDLFPTSAQEKPIVLYNETAGRVEWCGFITPKVYDGDYTNCLDEINIECADCISSLQYMDYAVYNETSGKSIVSLDKILGSICDAAGILERFYWTTGKKFDAYHDMTPETVYLSEQNFFSSDTDEPWKMDQVLEEICRYLGFTCVQFGNAMYLIDYLQYKTEPQLITRYYEKSNNYVFVDGHLSYLAGGDMSVSGDDFRNSSTNISLEPIYNKCTVKANMYACDSIIPSIFADENLENRLDNDDFYKDMRLTIPSEAQASFPYGTEWLFFDHYKKEDVSDSAYTFFMRVYDNTKGWTSIYNSSAETKPTSEALLKNWPGATIVDLGVVKNAYQEYRQQIIPSKKDYTRYLMVSQQNKGHMGSLDTLSEYLVFDLKNHTNRCPFDFNKSYLVIKGSANSTKYENRPYINPDWSNEPLKLGNGVLAVGECQLCFLVRVGNKYWNGSGWTSDRKVFLVPLKRATEKAGASNTDRSILNNVRYNLEVGEDGYLIPLSSATLNQSLTDEIQIQVHMPTCQYWLNGENVFNGFVWIKDLDIKIVQKGQANENKEGDMVYENVIDSDAVSELSEITCKLTSYTSGVAPSYSTVMYSNVYEKITPLSQFIDNASNEPRAGEENIIEKYVQEYQHQTRKITYTLESQMNGLRPWSRFYGFDPEEPNQMYVVLGEEINYRDGTNTITAVELK